MEIADFKAKLPAKKALIGFDYGSRRLGVAVSDLSRTIASSYTIVYRRDWTKDEAALRRIIEEKEAGGMVFGLPLQMNGEEGPKSAPLPPKWKERLLCRSLFGTNGFRLRPWKAS